MKTIIILVVTLICNTASCLAQKAIYYSYDATGNRIYRTLRSQRSKSVRKEMKTEDHDQVNLNGKQIKIKLDAKNKIIEININYWTENDIAIASIFSLDGKLLMKEKTNSQTTTIHTNDSYGRSFVLTVRLNGIDCSWKIAM